MGKILFLLVIALLVWMLFRGFFKSQVRKGERHPAQSVRGEDMVACARCGVNLPRSEAREEGGRLVCASNPHCHP